MSSLVRVDSLLAEKDAAVAGLSEKVLAALSPSSSGDRSLQSSSSSSSSVSQKRGISARASTTISSCGGDGDQQLELQEMATLLELEQAESDKLRREMNCLEALLDRQNDELEKFKADIDVLTSSGQLTDRSLMAVAALKQPQLKRSDSATQTTTTTTTAAEDSVSQTRQTLTEHEAKIRDQETEENVKSLPTFAEQLRSILKSLNAVAVVENANSALLKTKENVLETTEGSVDNCDSGRELLPDLQKVR